MNNSLRKNRLFWLVLMMAAAFTARQALAQEEPEDASESEEAAPEEVVDPNAWKKEREEILKEITAEADKRARATVTKEKIVDQLNTVSTPYEENIRKEETRYRKRFIQKERDKWRELNGFPDEYPSMTEFMNIEIPEWKVNTPVQFDPLQVKEDMSKKLTRIFEKACPPRDEDTLEEEGRAKYPMYKLEDGKKKPYVTGIVLRGGRGYGAKVEGRLEAVTVNRLKIGYKYIRREDLDDETQALFYDEVNQQLVDEYIAQEQRRYQAIKEGFIAEWISMTLPDMLMHEGYVPKMYLVEKFKEQRHSTAINNWIQRNVYLNTLYTTKLKKEIERITPQITKDFFENAAEKFGYEYNYEFVKEAGEPAGTGEWMPTYVAEQFRQQQAAAQANPDGMPNGDMPPDMMPPPPQPPRP